LFRNLSQSLDRFARIVREYDVGPGAFDARQRFEHYALFINPTLCAAALINAYSPET
jgi:hypothetical protein